MHISDYPDIRDATVRLLTEGEAADWRRERGYKVIKSHDRYWCETYPGLYQGVHWLSRFRREEARTPAIKCWGFRVALTEEDADWANASWPICLVPQLQEYDESALARTEKTALRTGRKNVRVVHLTEPSLLREQGYGIYVSALKRVGKEKVLTQEKYLSQIDQIVLDDRRLVAGALAGDTLVGYGDWFAVDGCVYGWHIYVGTEYVGTRASSAIQFEAWQAFRRTGQVNVAVNGMDTPELANLMYYKKRTGFEVVHIPSRLRMPYPARWWLGRTQPWAYYRFTGEYPSGHAGDLNAFTA